MTIKPTNRPRWLRGLILAAIGATALGTAPAWATVVTWNYTVDTTFANPAAGTGGTITPINSGTLLCWGTPAGGGANNAPCPGSNGSNQSALQIKPSSESGTINTIFGSTVLPGDAEPATKLIHFNNPIQSSSNSLTSATLLNSITLTATSPSGPLDGPFSANFSINFTETPNSGTCAAPPQSNPCSDIFVLGSTAMNQSFIYPGDGQKYWLHFFALDPVTNDVLPPLLPGECTAAGVSPGCFGFITEEGKSNPMILGLAISTEPVGVPEPGALGMMGLGVLGIGLAFVLNRRRRSSRAE